MISSKEISNVDSVGRLDLIPSELIDVMFEAGIPREVTCDLIESLPENLWPHIQLASIHLNPFEAKVCNAITIILAYLMQNFCTFNQDIDLQMSTAFHYLQGKVSSLRISGESELFDDARKKLDSVVISYLDDENSDGYYRAANEPMH